MSDADIVQVIEGLKDTSDSILKAADQNREMFNIAKSIWQGDVREDVK